MKDFRFEGGGHHVPQGFDPLPADLLNLKTIMLNNTFSINQIKEELKTTIVIQIFLANISSSKMYLMGAGHQADGTSS